MLVIFVGVLFFIFFKCFFGPGVLPMGTLLIRMTSKNSISKNIDMQANMFMESHEIRKNLLFFTGPKVGSLFSSSASHRGTTKEGLDIDDEDEKKKIEELKAEFEPLTKLMKEVLGDKVGGGLGGSVV